MKSIAIGAHLLRDDIEPVAEAVPVGDLFLSVLSVPDEQPVGDRELLLRVAAIRAKLLEVATFVAIRYGFTFSTVGEAQAKCAAHLQRWNAVLVENRTNVEVTLKVVSASPVPRPDRHAFSTGAEYLRALHAATQASNVDPGFREAAERLVLPFALRHRWSHRDVSSVELTALVPRAQLEEVRSAGEELRRSMPHVPFLLSGPWPLEVFADDDHK